MNMRDIGTGYLVVLRPLLFIFNIFQIRIVSQIVFALLLIVLFYFIYKKIDMITAIIVILSFVSIHYYIVAGSLQGNTVLLFRNHIYVIYIIKI